MSDEKTFPAIPSAIREREEALVERLQRPTTDKAAHRRLDTLFEEMFGEPGDDGLKTKMSKLADDVCDLKSDVGQIKGTQEEHGAKLDVLTQMIQATQDRGASWTLLLLGITAGASLTSCVIYALRVFGVLG